MAKNDTKTIFNVLSAKARKKEITNTDRKEVRQAVADLAAEIQGGYRLGRLSEICPMKAAMPWAAL